MSEFTENINLSKTDQKILADKTLSVVIRTHKIERLSFLDEALFSLAVQNYEDVEIVVLVQNGNAEFINSVKDLFEKMSFSNSIKYFVHSINVPQSTDGRSVLLNKGIEISTGRFLAFLDDDDVVYQNGYTLLIQKLVDTNAAIAVGGCRTAKVYEEGDARYITTKETPFAWGRNKFDLVKDNFIPIHSYIIDRRKVEVADLYFDADFSLLEDYDFLLRLAAKYDFDFSCLDSYVCEYRFHKSNSMPYNEKCLQETRDSYQKALDYIEQKKSLLKMEVKFSDILEIVNSRNIVEEVPDIVEVPVVIVSEEPTSEVNNPQLVRHALNSLGDKVYDFFSRHPRMERAMSKTVHKIMRRETDQ